MLVIVSDLHLTDGHSGATIDTRAFRIFVERLSDLAYDASWRATKNGTKYRPIKSMDLVLLGDILDPIRSSAWLETKVKPWNTHPDDPKLVTKVDAITDGILEHNRDSLKILKRIMGSGRGRLTVPKATSDGNPVPSSRDPEADYRQPVKVNIYYMVGNHDWFYHVQHKRYDPIRAKIVKAMGLANPSDRPFPHSVDECAKLQKTMRQHRVFARHGDIYDPLNYEDDRDASSLGDLIVIKLLSRFPFECAKCVDDGSIVIDPATVAALREIDNVRPLTMIPVWINGVLNRYTKDNKSRRQIKELWNGLVDEFLEEPFVKARDSWNPLDNVDMLQAGLKLSKGMSFGFAAKAARFIHDRFGGSTASYRKRALKEPAYLGNAADFVVYGHTHYHEIVPLDVFPTPDGEMRQSYINTGTWRRVFQSTIQHPEQQEFIGHNVMTYVTFFKGDERGGRPFESWSGALGVPR